MTDLAAPYSSADVADYYDAFTQVYLDVTGDFIQAFRPEDTDELMRYVSGCLALQPDMHLLDAGCGVCGPALWLARHVPGLRITALTNSAFQYATAKERIEAAGLSSNIEVCLGDYHQLSALFPPQTFDRVIFLESLGHSHDLQPVLSGIASVLRPGGLLYIKDFYRRFSPNPVQQEKIDSTIRRINECYLYNTLRLPELLATLQGAGLSLDTIRRPALETALSVTVAFETATQRLTYPHFLETVPADWYEVLAHLP